MNQTKALAKDSDSDSDDLDAENHFLCFLPHNGFIYELDGLRNQPIKHGALKAASDASSSEWAVQAGEIIRKRFLDKYDTEQFVTIAVGSASAAPTGKKTAGAKKGAASSSAAVVGPKNK